MQVFWLIFDTITHSLVYYCIACYVIWFVVGSAIICYDCLRIRRVPPLGIFMQGVVPFLFAPFWVPLLFILWIYSFLRKWRHNDWSVVKKD